MKSHQQIGRLLAVAAALLGTGLLAGVIAAGPPLTATAAVVAAGLLAVAATEL